MGKIYALISALLLVVGVAYSTSPTSYEWWLDNDYSSKTSGNMNAGMNSLEFDITSFPKGVHYFNLRFGYGDSSWGAVYRKLFYVAPNETRMTEYEYWLDNDFEHRKLGSVAANPIAFEVDFSGFDKSGVHYFNMRGRDDNGNWGSVYHKILIFNDVDKRTPIIGYRHFANGVDLGYVSVERKLEDSYMFDVDLPDSLRWNIKGKTPIFEGDKVSLAGNDSICYTMQLQTEIGWAVPVRWNVEISNKYSTSAVEMAVNSSRTFNVPSVRQFAAVKFKTDADSIYFRSDIPIAFDLYKSGEKMAEISPEGLAGMTMIKLAAGEYYGILRDAEEEKKEQFTFHIMDTPNAVPTPTISFADGMVSMTCSRENTEIRYTLDDEDPTEDSEIYKAPFSLKHNATVKAKAFAPGTDIEPSSIAKMEVDSYNVSVPYGRFDLETRLLTILCDTEGAKISYSFDPEGEWIPYEAPVSIEENCIVYAKAIASGYNDSEIGEITVAEFQCRPIRISYNGRFVSMLSDDSDVEIKYSLNDTYPADGYVYDGEFDVKGLCKVRAIARKAGYMDSEMSDYEIMYYADEEHAETAAEGLLESCYGWTDRSMLDNIESLTVKGYLNSADYDFIKSLRALGHLDLEMISDAKVPDGAFADMPLVSISMPSNIIEYGFGIFRGNHNLSAIVWNSNEVKVDSRLTSWIENPNLLLYLPYADLDGATGISNRIEAGRSEIITLFEGYPFYAPREFEADEIKYTRNFSKPTQIGICSGWETLTVPFDVETISDAVGVTLPFAISGESDRSFWLFRPSGNDWEETDKIMAYEPYLISMPNCPDYNEVYNIHGDVTFSAKNISVSASPLPEGYQYKQDIYLWPNYGYLAADENKWLINDDWYDGDVPGSVFVRGLREIRPFECYLTSEESVRRIPIFGDSSVDELSSTTSERIWLEDHGISIFSGLNRKIGIYDTMGHLIKVVDVEGGIVARITDLTPGIYFVDRKKVMVH